MGDFVNTVIKDRLSRSINLRMGPLNQITDQAPDPDSESNGDEILEHSVIITI